MGNKSRYLSGLTAEQQIMFLSETGRRDKSETVAVLLTLFLGGIGAHRFYLRQSGLGVVYALFCWTFIPAIVALCELFVIQAGYGNTMNASARKSERCCASTRLRQPAQRAPARSADDLK